MTRKNNEMPVESAAGSGVRSRTRSGVFRAAAAVVNSLVRTLAVPGLAYPFGYSSPLVRQVAREVGYRYAHAVANRTADADADLFRQPRLTIRRATTLAEFRRLADGEATLRLREDRALTRAWSVVRQVRAACC